MLWVFSIERMSVFVPNGWISCFRTPLAGGPRYYCYCCCKIPPTEPVAMEGFLGPGRNVISEGGSADPLPPATTGGMVEKPQQVPEAVQVEGANPGRNKRQLRVQLSDAVDEGKINIEPPGIVLDAQPPTCGLGRVSSALTSQGRSLVDRCFVVWRLNAACNVQPPAEYHFLGCVDAGNGRLCPGGATVPLGDVGKRRP